MGLFGFGKKKHAEENSTSQVQEAQDSESEAVAPDVDLVARGPWDSSEAPEDGKYLNLGGLRLPARDGVTLRLQVNTEKTRVVGVTITYKESSLELAPFAAPKSHGLWDDISAELMAGGSETSKQEGTFGTEIVMSVAVGGRTIPTRIVGVDGPRWMLRGIFTGKAAQDGEQHDALDDFFSAIVVDRGDDPLAPRDPLPLHPPVQVKEDEDQAPTQVPGKPEGPLTPMQNTEVQQTLARGPMFAEIR